MLNIDYNSYRTVKGFNRRVRFLVLHYTAQNFKGSIQSLTGPNVSAHYLVPDPTEKTYIEAGFKDLRVFNLVDENERAWHAGVSYWRGRNNINDTSIGIETVNLAEDNNGEFIFPEYNKDQVQTIKELALNILKRYPDIEPTNVVGHSDISVGRKSDPGAKFPWKELYEYGIGAWYDYDTVGKLQTKFDMQMPSKEAILEKLSKYGYDVSGTSTEKGYKNLIRAFQLHFRPEKYDGIVDVETAAILFALVDKYYS